MLKTILQAEIIRSFLVFTLVSFYTLHRLIFLLPTSRSRFPRAEVLRGLMANPVIKSGQLVNLSELKPSSQFFKQGVSLRVTGKLQEYTVETAMAIVVDGNTTLKIDTQHLRDLSFRMGSLYQFIGELHIQPDDEAILQARVGRNVDGMDLNLYRQTIELLRQFQADHIKNSTT